MKNNTSTSGNEIALPKLKINKFNSILAMKEVSRFIDFTADNFPLKMTVHKDDSGNEYFVIHSTLQVYGWTEDSGKAWKALQNIGAFNVSEIYDMLRGKK